MEVIATLMTENESDLVLMRDIAVRMKSRPLSVVAEDDHDLRTLNTIRIRMERRAYRIIQARDVARSIKDIAA